MTDTLIPTIFDHMSAGNWDIACIATICCLLTAIIKKLFVNKTVIDLSHRLDPCVFIPFVVAVILSIVYGELYNKGGALIEYVQRGMYSGALSTAMYKFWSSIDGKSLKQLLKDDLFKVFYDCLLDLTDIKEKLLNNQLTLDTLVGQVQTLVVNCKGIFANNQDREERIQALRMLMNGIFDEDDIEQVMPTLYITLDKLLTSTNNGSK
ncbi:MAG: hypothetical protein PHW00_01675 [Clostridia bacterium]|nr:hypothetical protein [Clostridia bacterium]